MKPFWLLDKHILDVSERKDDILSALESDGSAYVIMEFERYKTPSFPSEITDFSTSTCGITYGSVQFVESYTPHTNLQPGSFYDNKTYTVAEYLARHDPREFLNSDGFMLPYIVLKNNKEYYAGVLKTDRIFIRPNTGKKIFTGCVLNMGSEEDFTMLEKSSAIMDNTLVWVSSAKDILEEYRYIMVNGKVMGVSQYHKNGDIHIVEGDNPKCRTVAERMGENVVDFHNTFVCDVGINKGDGEAYVIEINCINTSAWYMADPKPIITELNNALVKEFEDNM